MDFAEPEPTPTSASAPQPRPSAADGQGSIDDRVVRNVVRSHLATLRTCYARGSERDATLAGQITVRFTIGPTGAVTSSELVASTLPTGGETIARCIAGLPNGWVFPPPIGGSVVITHPFTLLSDDPVRSLAGLSTRTLPSGRWFAVSGHAPETLVIEVLTAGGQRPVSAAQVQLELHGPDATRVATTDTRGLAVFTDVGPRGIAVVRVAGRTSESVLLGRGAMGTVMLIADTPTK